MNRLAIRNVWHHKRRLLGTLAAIALGVSFLTGTLVLGDTLRANFNSLFSDATAGTDAVVRGTTTIDGVRGTPSQRQLVDQSVADQVRKVDGVAAVAVSVQGYGQIIGKDGQAIGGNGPPRVAGNWIDDPRLNPYELVDGRAPERDGEVVINRGAAIAGHLSVGDSTTVQTPQPVPVTVVGIATFAGADGLGSATYAGFTLDATQLHVTQRPGQVDTIRVLASPGVSQSELVARIQPVLPPGTEAVTGAQYTQDAIQATAGAFLDLLTTFLVVFAGIALLVSTFSINNTFSILMAQRLRELALLRSLGADRRQVLSAVVLEAVVVGIVASAIGNAAGLGIAVLLKAMFAAFGFALPTSGLVVAPDRLLIAFAVGLVVTTVSAIWPALRASRVAPLAALRDTAVEQARVSPIRRAAGLVIGITGVALVVGGLAAGGDDQLRLVGPGAVLTVIAFIVSGPVVAPAVSRIVGWPIARMRGITGELARENSVRSPRRTAASAAALMIGVGVVAVFTVFVASLRSTIDGDVQASFGGDLVVASPSFGGGTLSPRLADEIGQVPQVADAVGLGVGAAKVSGTTQRLTVVDPTKVSGVLDLGVVDGSLAQLGSDQLAISKSVADANHWSVGSPVPVQFIDGATPTMRVGAIYTTDDLVGGYVLPRAAWTPHAVQSTDATVLVKLRDGVSLADGQAAVTAVTARDGNPTVQTRDDYATSVSSGFNIVLGVVYVLLALAIVIALMGIANTLSLSTYERTREIGLLRAVGQTRRQVRSMVRYESVLIALFGTLGGLGLGTFLGWAVTRAADATFRLPVPSLVAVAVLGAAAGVAAAWLPARRAARLDVLHAIAAE
jgi:putative ABC transport system permease protein